MKRNNRKLQTIIFATSLLLVTTIASATGTKVDGRPASQLCAKKKLMSNLNEQGIGKANFFVNELEPNVRKEIQKQHFVLSDFSVDVVVSFTDGYREK